MTRYEKFQAAIEAFEPGAGNTPIVCTNTEVNERVFRQLAGRKLKLWTRGTTVTLLISMLIVLAAAFLTILATQHAGGSAPTAGIFIPWVIVLLFRTTLVTVDQNGLNFYFIEIRLGSGYVVTDKMTLPFDQIVSMKVKTGKRSKNAHFVFTVMQNGKARKFKTSASGKMHKVPEQTEHLNALLQVLENKNLPVA